MTEMSFFWQELLIYAGLWLLFGLQHSGMASRPFKTWWTARLGRHGAWERVIFNLASLALALGILAYGHGTLPTTALFHPPEAVALLLLGLQGAGVVVTGMAMAAYDLSRFAGVRQVRAARRGETLPEEPLALSWLHRRVRHPIYFGLLLVIWCRPLSVLILATNTLATLYLIIGVVFEERKLVAVYGERYRELQRRVPCLIPWPGRTPPTSS